MKIAVFISGSGSNLNSIIGAVKAGDINAEIALVVSNKKNAYGLNYARENDIETLVFKQKDFASREQADSWLLTQLIAHKIDIVVLAGYMRIITKELVEAFAGKMLNIHPSLLPKYTGLDTYQRALDAGDKYCGTTVHFVIEKLDAGAIIAQTKVTIEANDNIETLTEKVKQQELKLYPKVVALLCDKKIYLKDDKAFYLGEELAQPLAL